jgi:hypothetical protein
MDESTATRRLLNKSSATDVLSAPVMKQAAADIDPFLTVLCNRFLSIGKFPAVCKAAVVTPIRQNSGSELSQHQVPRTP